MDAPLRGRLVRSAMAAICIALGTLLCAEVAADSGVPLSLQVRRLARLGAYDRHFKARAGSLAKVLVVSRKGDAESTFEQTSLVKAFSESPDIAGVPFKWRKRSSPMPRPSRSAAARNESRSCTLPSGSKASCPGSRSRSRIPTS
jgi:hypothetical protein